MNKELCIKLRNQAIDNVCNKRKLSDGQIERSWIPDDFDVEFARLVVQECHRAIQKDAKRFPKGDLIWIAAMQESATVVNKHFGIDNE